MPLNLEELYTTITNKDADKAASINALKAAIDEETSGLRTKNAELLGKLAAMKPLKEAAANLPEGISLNDVPSLVSNAQTLKSELEALKAEGKGKNETKAQFEERLRQAQQEWQSAHQEEIANLKSRAKHLESTLSSTLLDAEMTAAIAKEKGNPLFLAPHIKNHVKLVEENGSFNTVVVDPSGNPRYSVNEPGQLMTIQELVGEFKAKEEFAPAFATQNSGVGATGSGARGGSPTTANNPFKKGPSFNYTAQAKLNRENPQLAAQLKAAAAEEA